MMTSISIAGHDKNIIHMMDAITYDKFDLADPEEIELLRGCLAQLVEDLRGLRKGLEKYSEDFELNFDDFIGAFVAMAKLSAVMLKQLSEENPDQVKLSQAREQCGKIWEDLCEDGWEHALQYLFEILDNLDVQERIPKDWQENIALFKKHHQDGLSLIGFLAGNNRMDRVFRLFGSVDHIKPEHGLELAPIVEKEGALLFRSEGTKKEMVYAFSRELKVRQEGLVPKFHDDHVARRPRLFNAERELQILRQVATQLYFSFAAALAANKLLDNKTKATRPKIVEAQVMHLLCEGRSQVFIAVNEFAVTPYLQSLFEDGDSAHFKRMLTQAKKGSGKDKSEGAARSARYAKKIDARIFAEGGCAIPDSVSADDYARAQALAKVLRGAQVSIFNYDMKKKAEFKDHIKGILEQEQQKIYFIVVKNCSHQLRHAEEFLVDIAKCAKEIKEDVTVSIAGKKRPCMGCTGRMTGGIEDEPPVDHFGRFPGNVWINTVEKQPKEIVARTAHVLLTTAAHATVGRDGKKHLEYCTDSESDAGS